MFLDLYLPQQLLEQMNIYDNQISIQYVDTIDFEQLPIDLINLLFQMYERIFSIENEIYSKYSSGIDHGRELLLNRRRQK